MRSTALRAVMVLVVGGCGGAPAPSPIPAIPIATQPAGGSETPVACMAALLQGTLVLDPRTGLGIALDDGPVVPVRWPNGWTALDTVPVALANEDRAVIAHLGDRLAVGGGFGPGEIWEACPYDVKLAA
jgi:hypothetical protein